MGKGLPTLDALILPVDWTGKGHPEYWLAVKCGLAMVVLLMI